MVSRKLIQAHGRQCLGLGTSNATSKGSDYSFRPRTNSSKSVDPHPTRRSTPGAQYGEIFGGMQPQYLSTGSPGPTRTRPPGQKVRKPYKILRLPVVHKGQPSIGNPYRTAPTDRLHNISICLMHAWGCVQWACARARDSGTVQLACSRTARAATAAAAGAWSGRPGTCGRIVWATNMPVAGGGAGALLGGRVGAGEVLRVQNERAQMGDGAMGRYAGGC